MEGGAPNLIAITGVALFCRALVRPGDLDGLHVASRGVELDIVRPLGADRAPRAVAAQQGLVEDGRVAPVKVRERGARPDAADYLVFGQGARMRGSESITHIRSDPKDQWPD